MTDSAGPTRASGTSTSASAERPDPLGIVVVSFGSADLLRRTLAPAGLSGPDVRIVVVDNFSSTANRRAVETLGATEGWHVVGMPDNRGFGAACNAGIVAARSLGCRTFLFLNPDAVISAEVVAELRAHSLREPLALISPRLVDSAGEVVFRVARTDLRDGRVRRRPAGADPRITDPGDWLCGACVVVHDDLLARIGGFDEDYFLYWEDVDLGYRAVAAGGRVILREDLDAVHDEGGTHADGRQPGAKSALYYRYNCRNRLAFAARHLRRRQLLRWVLATPAVSWEILLRGGRRQLLHSPGLLWAAVAGSLAGIALALPALLTGARPPTRRTSVLMVSPGAELYGSDRVFLDSVEAALRAADVVVALPGGGPLVAELERRGARVVTCRMPVLRKAALRPVGLVRLVRDAVTGIVPALALLRRYGAGGVLVNTTILPSWLLLARLARRRVICHVHEAEWPGPAILHRLLLLPLRAAHSVVANSRFTHDVLLESVPGLAGRLAVVANPVQGPEAPAAARPLLDGPLRLLFVGRLSPRKGPDVAIAVLRELLSRGIDARLTLLGSVFPGYEWFETQLRSSAADDLAERVDFRGFAADVWPVLEGADVVLVPSVLDESFGNAAVEAVLAARPSVVSDLRGLREAVAGYAAARVVEPGRPDLWADAVEKIAADWQALREAASGDAAQARRRHAPARYRHQLAQLLLARGTRNLPPGTGRGSAPTSEEPVPVVPR
jgi:GT2 family glycosyltransferase/glycosyltransferase involved in cell wall biosynthesis